MTSRWVRSVAAAAVLAAAAGCGAATPPGESAPGLRAQLSRIDTALADRQYGTARSALDALVRETVAARDAGTITAEQANRILAAAARLAAGLPSQPSPAATPRPTASPTPDDDEDKPADEQDEKKDDGDEKDGEKKDDGGDGHDSGNGPDDGHGN